MSLIVLNQNLLVENLLSAVNVCKQNCLTLKDFLKKLILKKVSRRQQKHEKIPIGVSPIGVSPITQLRTCAIKIVTFKGGHLMS